MVNSKIMNAMYSPSSAPPTHRLDSVSTMRERCRRCLSNKQLNITTDSASSFWFPATNVTRHTMSEEDIASHSSCNNDSASLTSITDDGNEHLGKGMSNDKTVTLRTVPERSNASAIELGC
jgi:hypothetical protein